MSIPDPIAALVAYLRADPDTTSLTGGRIFGQELPETEAGPMPRACLVLTDAGGAPLGPGANDAVPVSVTRVDVRAYGATPQEAKAVSLAAHAALKGLRRAVVGQALLHSATVAGGPNYLRDPDTAWPFVLSTYQVLAAEVPVT